MEFNVRGRKREKTAKFCSHKCCSIGQKRGERKPELRKICVVCGKRYLPYYAQRNKYNSGCCSAECRHKQINSDTKYKCDYCGKSFTRKKFRFKNKYKHFYCSTTCRNKANRGKNYNPNRIDYRDGQYKKVSKKLKDEAKNCEDCKKSFEKYEAHHIIPPWLFDSREEAHKKSNLIVLCKKCHRKRHTKTMKFFFDKFREFCKNNPELKNDIIRNWNKD